MFSPKAHSRRQREFIDTKYTVKGFGKAVSGISLYCGKDGKGDWCAANNQPEIGGPHWHRIRVSLCEYKYSQCGEVDRR